MYLVLSKIWETVIFIKQKNSGNREVFHCVSADAQQPFSSDFGFRSLSETFLNSSIELQVILNTEQSGAAKIQEDTENLKVEFERLQAEVADLRQKLTQRHGQLDDLNKAHRLLQQWLEELEVGYHCSLSIFQYFF